MTAVVTPEASARPARGALRQAPPSPPRVPVPFEKTSPKRPPRGGAGRVLAGGAGRVVRGGIAP